MSFLNLDSLKKNFSDFVAIKDFSLTIESGELIVFVGPSGCGKSTLLRLISGLEKVDSGNITLNDKDITHTPASKRDLAMVFQSYALYPHMSVFHNLGFPLRISKVNPKKIREKVTEVANTLNLTPYLHRLPKELSGGQRQRVAIGRAIVREPKIFLFDEPLSNLDASLRGQTRVEIANLHRRLGVTTIFVTHDQVEAMTLADRVVILKEGNMEQVGKPLEVYDHPNNKFVAQFIGTPKMNIFAKDKLPTKLKQKISRHLKKKKVSEATLHEVGFRAEHVTLSPAKKAGDFKAEVVLIENLGVESLVYLKSEQGVDFIAKSNVRMLFKKNHFLSVTLDLEKIHFFDGEGKAL